MPPQDKWKELLKSATKGIPYKNVDKYIKKEAQIPHYPIAPTPDENKKAMAALQARSVEDLRANRFLSPYGPRQSTQVLHLRQQTAFSALRRTNRAKFLHIYISNAFTYPEGSAFTYPEGGTPMCLDGRIHEVVSWLHSDEAGDSLSGTTADPHLDTLRYLLHMLREYRQQSCSLRGFTVHLRVYLVHWRMPVCLLHRALAEDPGAASVEAYARTFDTQDLHALLEGYGVKLHFKDTPRPTTPAVEFAYPADDLPGYFVQVPACCPGRCRETCGEAYRFMANYLRKYQIPPSRAHLHYNMGA